MILLKVCEPSLNLDKFLFVCLQQRRCYTVSNTDKLWRTTALIYVDNGQYYTVSVIRSRELGQAPILVFLTLRQASSSHPCQVLKGAFNNYVDKMRGGGGQKMSVFVHVQGIKTVHAGRGGEGSKNGKILTT